eukprot:CAMPEP_0178433600 /NCGR_PEP_ID=MMETSP0689_2-20121128/32989_1 /TAXON_ID=160604 /ORGANISM="Amphidinium massartii, Strain CS-259" /LENGTH=96 /DNA_ID=CAMNT_0020055633 /DNA_START=15 /DNA_END=302 /DNA_ORIENTATION=-
MHGVVHVDMLGHHWSGCPSVALAWNTVLAQLVDDFLRDAEITKLMLTHSVLQISSVTDAVLQVGGDGGGGKEMVTLDTFGGYSWHSRTLVLLTVQG